MAKNILPITYIYKPLSDIHQQRINDVLNLELLHTLLKFGVIAGGFPLYALTGIKSGDVDIFILNGEQELLMHSIQFLNSYFSNRGYTNPIYRHYRSVIVIEHENLILQLILTGKSTIEEVLTEFDMDYVQCGLFMNKENQIEIVRSTIAEIAHEYREISYIKDYSSRRIKKSLMKGFKVPDCNMVNIPASYEEFDFPEITFDALLDIIPDQIDSFLKSYSKFDPIDLITPSNFTRSLFEFNRNLNPTEHLEFLHDIRNGVYTDSEIIKLLLMGDYQQTIIYVLYKYKITQSIKPSMILSADKKSLKEITQLVKELIKN